MHAAARAAAPEAGVRPALPRRSSRGPPMGVTAAPLAKSPRRGPPAPPLVRDFAEDAPRCGRPFVVSVPPDTDAHARARLDRALRLRFAPGSGAAVVVGLPRGCAPDYVAVPASSRLVRQSCSRLHAHLPKQSCLLRARALGGGGCAHDGCPRPLPAGARLVPWADVAGWVARLERGGSHGRAEGAAAVVSPARPRRPPVDAGGATAAVGDPPRVRAAPARCAHARFVVSEPARESFGFVFSDAAGRCTWPVLAPLGARTTFEYAHVALARRAAAAAMGECIPVLAAAAAGDGGGGDGGMHNRMGDGGGGASAAAAAPRVLLASRAEACAPPAWAVGAARRPTILVPTRPPRGPEGAREEGSAQAEARRAARVKRRRGQIFCEICGVQAADLASVRRTRAHGTGRVVVTPPPPPPTRAQHVASPEHRRLCDRPGEWARVDALLESYPATKRRRLAETGAGNGPSGAPAAAGSGPVQRVQPVAVRRRDRGGAADEAAACGAEAARCAEADTLSAPVARPRAAPAPPRDARCEGVGATGLTAAAGGELPRSLELSPPAAAPLRAGAAGAEPSHARPALHSLTAAAVPQLVSARPARAAAGAAGGGPPLLAAGLPAHGALTPGRAIALATFAAARGSGARPARVSATRRAPPPAEPPRGGTSGCAGGEFFDAAAPAGGARDPLPSPFAGGVASPVAAASSDARGPTAATSVHSHALHTAASGCGGGSRKRSGGAGGADSATPGGRSPCGAPYKRPRVCVSLGPMSPSPRDRQAELPCGVFKHRAVQPLVAAKRADAAATMR